MLKKVLASVLALGFALGVLMISVLRTASVKYSFSPVSPNFTDENIVEKNKEIDNLKIDYLLAYPGTVIPGHFFWPLKAVRDRVWLLLTTNITRKAELNLLFADKRIGASLVLFENKKCELGYTTLTKAQKYFFEASRLEKIAREEGINTQELVVSLIKASLKYQQVIEKILLISPDEARPGIILIQNSFRDFYPTNIGEYKGRGYDIPEYPLDEI